MDIELIALLIVGVIGLVFLALASLFALGLYLGWFNLRSGNTTTMDAFTFSAGSDINAPTTGTTLRHHLTDQSTGPDKNEPLPDQCVAFTFDLDSANLASFREAFPDWHIEAADAATSHSRTQDWRPGAADLLVVGATLSDTPETLGLCRVLREQAGPVSTPILALVPPDQPALVAAVLKAGANGYLVSPVRAKEWARGVARVQTCNQPGRHTMSLQPAQDVDRWQDDGGQT